MAARIKFPRPAHGWKAFTTEIVVVVLGVLIALGLGAIVEWANWQSKAIDGKQRLKDELLWNGANMAEQVTVAPCVHAQLERLEARLAASKGILDPAPLIETGSYKSTMRIPQRAWLSQSWEALQQDGTSSHLSGDTQAQLGRIYQKILFVRDLSNKTDDRRGVFTMFGFPVVLTAEIKAEFLRDIMNQHQGMQFSALNSAQTLAIFRKLDFAPSEDQIEARRLELTTGNKSAVSSVEYCRANNLPLADWRTEVAKVDAQ